MSSKPPLFPSPTPAAPNTGIATNTVEQAERNVAIGATVLAALEVGIAKIAGVDLWPVTLCAALILAGVFVSLHRSARRPYRPASPYAFGIAVSGRRLTLLLLFKVAALAVCVTGGSLSELTGLLYLPLFLGALFFGLSGSVLMGLCCGALLLVSGYFFPFASGAFEAAIQKVAAMVVVALGTGAFAQGLTRTAADATRRAAEQEKRAGEQEARALQLEWFNDTSSMMDALHNRESMLSIAMIRLDDLLPGETSAIYLRTADDGLLELSQLMRRGEDSVSPILHLTGAEESVLREMSREARLWPNVQADASDLGAFRHLDPSAQGVLVAPLRAVDELVGAIYIGSRTPHRLTAEHRELLSLFAQRIVYPIQRMRLQALATTDALTGLNNRRAFRQRLREETERARRYRHELSLILLDIDHFKRVNDTYGHRAGDAILAQVATVLRRTSRNIDLPARYGGEEMALICPETKLGDARALAERIRKVVEETVFELPDGAGATRITVSLGVANHSESRKNEAQLIEGADQALYAAKAGGRNQVVATDDDVAPALYSPVTA